MAVGESLVLGTELNGLKFTSSQDWWVHWNDVGPLWKAQPTYIIVQCAYLLGALLTLLHALSHGGRLPYLWLASVGHGLTTEAIAYVLPDVDNFWHSQTPLMFLGRRLPLHIAVLYPCFLYNAVVAISKLRLPRWAEPFAVGLTVVLIDLPYDIVSVKFVHWTWHDTDPNVADRHYWVPWTSYYFHATFAASFIFWFQTIHTWLGGSFERRWVRNSFVKEVVTMLFTSVLGAVGGVLMFVPLYHPLHDVLKIHSEVIVFILLSVFLLIAWAGDRVAKDGARPTPGVRTVTWRTMMLLFHLLVHYSVFLGMAILGQPEREVSTGLHEQVGPCTENVSLQTSSGIVLQKRKYLCLQDYDEKYFDFHCLPGGRKPKNGAHWYTICGTPFENRAEYIAIVSVLCVLAFGVFYNLHFRSGPEDVLAGEKQRKTKLKTK